MSNDNLYAQSKIALLFDIRHMSSYCFSHFNIILYYYKIKQMCRSAFTSLNRYNSFFQVYFLRDDTRNMEVNQQSGKDNEEINNK